MSRVLQCDLCGDPVIPRAASTAPKHTQLFADNSVTQIDICQPCRECCRRSADALAALHPELARLSDVLFGRTVAK